MVEVTEFLKKIDNFGCVNYYRGHADVNWKLLPSLARTQTASEDVLEWGDLEAQILRDFEKHGCSIIETPAKNQLEWMIHAQHHGLPTRLLDWSSNPLKALFFAVEDPKFDHLDGMVFGVSVVTNFVADKFVEINKYNKIVGFHSSSLNKRVAAQEGCFTLTPLPKDRGGFMEVDDRTNSIDYLGRYRIPKEHKPALRKQLKRLGITHQFLFPDLDGLATSIKRDLML